MSRFESAISASVCSSESVASIGGGHFFGRKSPRWRRSIKAATEQCPLGKIKRKLPVFGETAPLKSDTYVGLCWRCADLEIEVAAGRKYQPPSIHLECIDCPFRKCKTEMCPYSAKTAPLKSET